MSLLKSGQGLISEIKGAAQLLDQAKNLPGVGALLADIPGSGEVLGSLQSIGSDLFKNGAEALGLDPKELAAAGLDLLGLDVTTLTGLDASALLGGSETVIAEAAPLAEAAVEFIASFW
jgi:hypothetical protein